MTRENQNDARGIRSDSLIGDDIAVTLARDERIEAAEILAQVSDGEVTLTGEVPEPQMRELAEQCVAALPGVRAVRNLIRYDDGADSFGPRGEAVRTLDPDESTGPTEAPRTQDSGNYGKSGKSTQSK
ncbi:MAG TPA: BON domain-containing protein [Stenotrophomonas sp.]|nr:BON domain-containing protein [Stenotrophomonas sp.]